MTTTTPVPPVPDIPLTPENTFYWKEWCEQMRAYTKALEARIAALGG